MALQGIDVGGLRHRVTLTIPGGVVPDGDGGYTQTPATLAARIPASVEPATVRALERLISNTVLSTASHLVTMRYRPGVTTKATVVFHDGATDRPMPVTGVHDIEERHLVLVLECTEVVA